MRMLTGLSSLLFGSGGADDAAVDQNLANRPTPLNTQDADNGWVLVDVADNEGRSEADHQPMEERFGHNETATETEGDEQLENQAGRRPVGNAVQQRNAQRAARATRALALEAQQEKLTYVTQRHQRVAKTKQLSRKRLEAANKAHMVRGCGRRLASAKSRVLRPSGQMTGRQIQRH